jgi:hypothetical protein
MEVDDTYYRRMSWQPFLGRRFRDIEGGLKVKGWARVNKLRAGG